MDRFYGDFRWADRPGCFANPQCREVVSDLEAAKSALLKLYPPEVCCELVESKKALRVVGLFFDGGWSDRLDELLQLGADLSLCDGWEAKPKLVADLRSIEGYDGARFEVGVWAGLRREGLQPVHEVAASKADPRPDFVVEEDGKIVAIELKNLSDPNLQRNLAILESELSGLFARFAAKSRVGAILLAPYDELWGALEGSVDDFIDTLQDEILPGLQEISTKVAVGVYDVRHVGLLRCSPRDPSWNEGLIGTVGVESSTGRSLKQLTKRALRQARSGAPQLLAVSAHIRVAAIWGSRDSMPARAVAAEAYELVEAKPALAAGIDYIGFLNSHRCGPRPGWVTEVAYCPVARRLSDLEGARWARGIGGWSLLHSASADRPR